MKTNFISIPFFIFCFSLPLLFENCSNIGNDTSSCRKSCNEKQNICYLAIYNGNSRPEQFLACELYALSCNDSCGGSSKSSSKSSSSSGRTTSSRSSGSNSSGGSKSSSGGGGGSSSGSGGSGGSSHFIFADALE